MFCKLVAAFVALCRVAEACVGLSGGTLWSSLCVIVGIVVFFLQKQDIKAFVCYSRTPDANAHPSTFKCIVGK